MSAGTSKGMFLDGPPMVNPEGTYRFALNAVNQGDEGERGFLSNEKGTTEIYSLPKTQIGHVNLLEKDVVIISLGQVIGTYWFEIGVQTGDTYTTYIKAKDPDFTLFSKQRQVRGEFRLINGCERTIYLCTPYLLSINLDSLDDYLLPGYTQDTANSTGEGWDFSKFKLFTENTYSYFSDITVNNSGGNLVSGAYQATITHIDGSNNEIGWTDISQTIPIVDEPYGSFTAVDGGLQIPTTKSITFTLANLDTKFPFYKLGIITNINGVPTVYKTDIISTTSNVYTLQSVSGLLITSLNDITINPIVIDRAEDITQYDNKLLLAGISELDYEPDKFQKAANDYKVSWVSRSHINENTTSESFAGHKSYQAYVDVRGYMKDEVYALGIVWVFKNGYETEVFHIPGREKNTGVVAGLPSSTDPNIHSRPLPTTGWDDTVYTIGSPELPIGDARHITTTGDLERWQVYNTATLFNGPSSEEKYYGDLAYWESTIPYPDDVDCEGVRIYPEGNIRHHKMPDATLLTNTNKYLNSGNYLGIKITDITPPVKYENDVAGFFIVRVKRDNSNSSVLDKGLMTRMLYADKDSKIDTTTPGVSINQEKCYFQPFPWNGEAYNASGGATTNVKAARIDNGFESLHGMHTPRIKFTDKGLPINYVKIESKMETIAPRDITTGVISSYQMQSFGLPSYTRYAWLTSGDTQDSNYIPTCTNRTISQQAYLDADSYLPNVFDAQVNNIEQQEVHVIKTEDDIPNPASDTDMTGAAYTEKATFYFASLKQYLPAQYGNLQGLNYMRASKFIPYVVGGVDTVFFGGDTFISALYMRKQAKIAYDSAAPNDVLYPINHQYTATGSWSQIHWRLLTKFYTESIINCGLRNEGTENFEVYYPKSYNDGYAELSKYLTLEGILDLDGVIAGGGTISECDLIPNYYEFNFDYLVESSFKLYVGIRPFFDWCNTCYNEFKRRIYYSNTATEEDIFDSYKVFLANNYKDLPSYKGEITSLFLKDDKLYTHTTDSMWLLSVDYKTINSDDGGSIKIGTGSFLSLPTMEIKSLKGGYMGCDYNQTIQNTEQSAIFLSKNKLFSVGEGLVEISNLGLREFFDDNTEIFFLQDFKNLTGLDFPAVNTSWGVGYISSYDREKHRYIITKLDYKILDNLINNYKGLRKSHTDKEEGDIVWNASTSDFEIYTNGTYSTLSYTNSDYFENKSFTLSFDTEQNQWVSFHSYMPKYMFNTYYNLFSYSAFNIHKHNSGEYQSFYGEVKPHIIELIYPENALQSNITKNISLVSHARKYNLVEKNWKDELKTFDQIWLYNDTQSTGLLNVFVTNSPSGNPYMSLVYNYDTVLFYRADKTWKFKRFSNKYTNQSAPIFDSSWDSIKADYFIDKVPTVSEHTLNDPFTQGKMRDKYVIVRYILNTPNDHKITTLTSVATNNPSTR